MNKRRQGSDTTHHPGNRLNLRNVCELKVECIKISGRRSVFHAKSTNYSQDGLGLVSRKAVKKGTNLIVRLLDFPPPDMRTNQEWIRVVAMAEVRWIREIMTKDGLSYAMGMKYVCGD